MEGLGCAELGLGNSQQADDKTHPSLRSSNNFKTGPSSPAAAGEELVEHEAQLLVPKTQIPAPLPPRRAPHHTSHVCSRVQEHPHARRPS